MLLSVAASRGTTRCVRTGAQALRVDGQLERETTLRDFRIEGALDALESGLRPAIISCVGTRKREADGYHQTL
jgi:hypothetical protein